MFIREHGRRHIGWFDVHVPHHGKLEEALAFAHETGCDHFIIGGDFLNLEWASHWNEKVFGEIGNTKLREMLFSELDAGEKLIKKIRETIPKNARLWYIPGNHESWLWYACFHHRIVEIPWTADSVTFKSDVAALLDRGLGSLLSRLLNAKKHRMTVLPYNEPLKIGSLVYLHGHQFGGANPVNASARKWPHVNIVFGHHHTHQVQTIYNSADSRETFQHVACPALCGLSPGYLNDKATRWLNGFWVCDWRDGLFDGRVVKVLDGKIIRQ